MTSRVVRAPLSRAGIAAVLGIAVVLSAGAGERNAAAGERNSGVAERNAVVGEPTTDGAGRNVVVGERNSRAAELRVAEQPSGVFVQPARDPGGTLMTGNLQVDFFGLTALRDGPALEPLLQSDAGGSADPSRRSPWLASGLSLLVPGTGEFYAGSYWKAALFFAVEVAALAVAYSYDRRGDQQTDRYQDFANRHWSVVKYAKYAETLVGATPQFNWRVPGTEGMDEFDRPWTQVNWSELNRMERHIAGYYSHTLPPYGEQQYFELIGKYPQYNQGWNDAPPSFNYGDPLTPNFQFYSGERGKANEYYSSASGWVTAVIINHVLSAIDAAWSAHLHNRAQASVGVRMIPTQDGYAPMTRLTVKYSF
jgi:hypothetical protein